MKESKRNVNPKDMVPEDIPYMTPRERKAFIKARATPTTMKEPRETVYLKGWEQGFYEGMLKGRTEQIQWSLLRKLFSKAKDDEALDRKNHAEIPF